MTESYSRSILFKILTNSNAEYKGIWEQLRQSKMMTNLDDLIHNYIESEYCYAILTMDEGKMASV